MDNASCLALVQPPLSQGNEIKLAAKTNVWGRALNDVKDLKEVKADDLVFIEAV